MQYQLLLSILIWYPFVKSYEKTYGNKEEETNAISAEDAAILDDLGLRLLINRQVSTCLYL